MNNRGMNFNGRLGVALGAIALIIALSYQGISQSMGNGGGGSTGFVSNQGGGGGTTNNANFIGTTTFQNVKGTGNLVFTNGVDGTVTNYLGGNAIYSRKTDNHFFDFITTNNTTAGFMTATGVPPYGFALVGGGGATRIDWDEVNGFINIMNGNYTMHPNNFNIAGGVTTTFTGLVGVSSNLTIGSSAVNTITGNAATSTWPNGHYFNSTFWISNAVSALGTNFAGSTEKLRIHASGVNGVALAVLGTPGGTANLPMVSYKSPTGTELSGVQNDGKFFIGNATISSSGMDAINSGGAVSFINNTATPNSSTVVSGGTDPTSFAQLASAGFTFVAGGKRIKRTLTGTNYTLRNNDFYIANRPTTGTVITNFLPAASISITNGYQYSIYDAGVAASTNIVIFPNGANTINGAASKTISVTGTRVVLTFDGGNWEAVTMPAL